MIHFARLQLVLLTLFFLTSCGGGGSSESTVVATPPIQSPPSPSPPPTAPTPAPPSSPEPDESEFLKMQTDAARLLNQATFGATIDEIDTVVEMGVEEWIDEQLSEPMTSHLDYLTALEDKMDPDDMYRAHRIEAWWRASLFAKDQLRQRVAYALSQIMVISDRSNFADDIWGIANYYDMLGNNAFGNFRDLLEDVTLSPIMGMYLSMLGNEKPDAQRNVRPDENYARELMQLFSIGLIELNLDGSPKLDANGNTISTYNQSIIEGYAHVFTGWNFADATEETWYRWWENYNSIDPMTSVRAFHDTQEKRLLGGVVIPANQKTERDLKLALDSLFNHPNVGPFIGKQLIQRLVTSNPSPLYVERIATVFNDNGEGVRGDMGAVIKAILLDEEAREGHIDNAEGFGKLREPIIKATHLWRAFNASSPNGRIQLGYPDYFFNQAPLSSPSVFNFYLPDFTQPGPLVDANLVAPELQIMTETYVVRATNFMAYTALWGHALHNDEPSDEDILIDYADDISMLDEPQALVDRLNLVLMANSMSEEYQQILRDSLSQTYSMEPADRIANLVFLIMSSPQYNVQQ